MAPRLFPAQLKYWRGRRGHSQLDLALAAGISARHLAFLESGRSQPSEGMVLRLFATLETPLRVRYQVVGSQQIDEAPAMAWSHEGLGDSQLRATAVRQAPNAASFPFITTVVPFPLEEFVADSEPPCPQGLSRVTSLPKR